MTAPTCLPCRFGECPTPPARHTWMDDEDAENAGLREPFNWQELAKMHPCGCYCNIPKGQTR